MARRLLVSDQPWLASSGVSWRSPESSESLPSSLTTLALPTASSDPLPLGTFFSVDLLISLPLGTFFSVDVSTSLPFGSCYFSTLLDFLTLPFASFLRAAKGTSSSVEEPAFVDDEGPGWASSTFCFLAGSMTEKVERLVEKRLSWRNEDETSNPHEWFQRNDEKITVGGKRRPEMQRLPASETRAANEMRANF